MDAAHRGAVVRHSGLLGTVVDVRVDAGDPPRNAAVDRTVVDELIRLEAIFSAYDAGSELNRWKRDEVPEPSPELVHVMATAQQWQLRSAGAFNPMTGVLSKLWRNSVADGAVPSATQLRAAALEIQSPRFEVADGVLRRIGDCSALDLNAVAKGFIVDRAVAVAWERHQPTTILVSAGGDLLHRGDRAARVGIENPLRPYDNEPPLLVINLDNAGLATSGGSRRGVVLDGKRFSHVLDPTTGHPVDQQASITVVATSAMDADVLATVLGMSSAAEAVRASDELENVACLVVDATGSTWPNSLWRSQFPNPSASPSGPPSTSR